MAQNNTRYTNETRYNYREKLEDGILSLIHSPSNPTIISVNGWNNDIGVTYEDLNNTDDDFDWSTSGSTLSIVSTDIADALGGTGIRTFTIFGLDTNWDYISELVTMNGLTPVVTTKTYLRVNNILINSYGTNLSAVGEITASGDGFNWFKIQASDTSVQLGRYSIGRGYTAILNAFGWSAGAAGDFILRICFAIDGLYPMQTSGHYPIHASSQLFKGVPFKLTEKSDFLFQAKKETGGGGGVEFSASFTGWLFENNKI